MDFTLLGWGAVIAGSGRALAHPLNSQAHPLWNQAQPIRMGFPHKRAYYRQKHSSVSSAVWVAGLRQSPQVKKPDVEVLGWHGYTWSAIVRPVRCTTKFSKNKLEVAYGRKLNIQFSGNSSGGHSCIQHANCTLPQSLRHLWHCVLGRKKITF
jgi:hypothetical protein